MTAVFENSNTLASFLLRLAGSCSRPGEDYSVDHDRLGVGFRATMGNAERASVGADVEAEGRSLMSRKVSESATAPRQMAPAIIAPTTSPQVVRSSNRGSCAFMVFSSHASRRLGLGRPDLSSPSDLGELNDVQRQTKQAHRCGKRDRSFLLAFHGHPGHHPLSDEGADWPLQTGKS